MNFRSHDKNTVQMTLPLITAAFTSYNAHDTIEAALRSALDQDWPNLEVLVVDDVSADDTLAVIDTLIASRPGGVHIRVLRQPRNLGVAAARNRLIEEASGEFLAFFDDDDYSTPDRLRLQYERLLEAERITGSHLVLCHTAREQHFPDGLRAYEPTIGTQRGSVALGKAVADRILIGRLAPDVVGSCATCSQMGRTETYRLLDGFDARLRRGSDTDLNVRLALRGGVFAGIEAPLVYQRMTIGHEKRVAVEKEAHLALFNKYREYLEQIGWLEFHLEWQKVRYAHIEGRTAEFLKRLIWLGIRNPWKLMQKLRWSMPAKRTRDNYIRWHRDHAG